MKAKKKRLTVKEADAHDWEAQARLFDHIRKTVLPVIRFALIDAAQNARAIAKGNFEPLSKKLAPPKNGSRRPGKGVSNG